MNALVESLFGKAAKQEESFDGYLFECNNDDWDQATATTCKITFGPSGNNGYPDKSVSPQDYYMSVDHDGENFHKKFNLREMMNIDRFFDEDDNQVCFDWATQNSLGEVANFGLKFPDAAQGTNFGAKLSYLLEGGATKKCELAAACLSMYDPDAKQWREIVQNVKVVVSRRNVNMATMLIYEPQSADLSHPQALISANIGAELMAQPDDTNHSIAFHAAVDTQNNGVKRLLILNFGDSDEAKKNYFELKDTLYNLQLERVARNRDDETDVEMYDFQDPVSDAEDNNEEVEWDEQDRKRSHLAFKKKGENKMLQLSDLHSKGFMLRYDPQEDAGMVSIFKKDSDDGLEETATTKYLKDTKGRKFKAKKAILHEGQQKLLLLNQDKPGTGDNSKVYVMDLNREQIVQEWDAGKNTDITDVMGLQKGVDRTQEKTFLGVGGSSLFLMDPRMSSGSSGQRATTYKYTNKMGFNAGATDASGHVAVAGALGDVRCYDGGVSASDPSKFKRAKTHFRGLGHTIKHVDVTNDGNWILGTCDDYLVLLPTAMDGNKNAFQKAMPVSKRPRPIKLNISIQDIARYNLLPKDIKYTTAVFDENDQGETTIATSMKNLAITWDFNKVKRGDLNAYKIKPMVSKVVDLQFVHNNPKDVIVATYDGVDLQTRQTVGQDI